MRARRWAFIPQSVCDRVRILLRSHSHEETAEILGLCRSEISKIKKRRFKAADYSCRKRKMPDSFHIVVRRMTTAELTAHYKTSDRCVTRWKSELLDPAPDHRKRANRRPKRERPKSFVENQTTMSIEQLKKHYSAGNAVIERWFREIGSKARPRWNGHRQPKEKTS